ncbi:MAG: hypothetical protein LBT76_00530, partial [Tannerella sp.]|nr:hypothetical protein [Tannerella sp.]
PVKGCRPHVFWEIKRHSHHSEQIKNREKYRRQNYGKENDSAKKRNDILPVFLFLHDRRHSEALPGMKNDEMPRPSFSILDIQFLWIASLRYQ